ncbi:HET-domain-containing protein [Daldinia sp. FL1419]|nr:HET-domain-containing protein [Daldinia sp. FL1419]
MQRRISLVMEHVDYSYKDLCPLDDPATELRVLEIANNGRDPVECRLVKHQEGLPYSTLSWCWGRPGQEREAEIRILQSSRSYTFPVPQNLESAIRALRRNGQLRVWIDYICIDQKNMDEKNLQVPMMASIYGGADCVYVWLGDEKDNSKLAIDFIRNRVLDLGRFDRLTRDNQTAKEWQALSALMRRRWFSRRWIVQEIAVAKGAVILCGKEKIGWKDFADAVSLFNEVEAGTHSVSEVMRNDRDLGHRPDFFGDVSQLSATKLVEETNNLFRTLSGTDREAKFNLEYLVSKLTTFDSTEPRDTIYALLAIARDTVPVTPRLEDRTVQTLAGYMQERLVEQLAKNAVAQPYHVDYRLPLSDVYVQFVKWVIEKSDKTYALDIICRPWAPVPEASIEPDEEENAHWRLKTNTDRPQGEGEDTLPSWVSTLSRAAFGMVGTGQGMTRKNADSLVGLPRKRVYSAAGSRILTDNFRIEDGVTMFNDSDELNELHYHSLFVEGFVLDTVRMVKESSQQGSIPSSWIKMARRNGANGGDLADEFWRTLVADRSPTGENAPRYYHRLVRHALEQGVQGDALNTKDIVNWGNGSIVGEVFRRVQSVIWNRSMMRTEKGYLGLAPQYTHTGDLICILYGCSVPVILREFKKSSREVDEEERQRQQKLEELRKKREAEAARKYSRLWRMLAFRRTAPSDATDGQSRKRKDAPIDEIPRSNEAKRRAASPHRRTSRAQAGGEDQSESSNANARAPLKSDPYTYYQIIGECYVDGMMNGEALSRRHTSMLFEIR